jgi:hypothetical protein
LSTLHIVAALFALFMLFRHVPTAKRLLGGGAHARPMAIVSAVNVLLALVILGFAVRGLVSSLYSR